MALVSDKLIDRWLEEDSFVYKNFAYIYENPIWGKNIPSGYSLCPYFWMSIIIGFVLLRVLLVPVYQVVSFIISRCLCSPLITIDRKLTDFFDKHRDYIPSFFGDVVSRNEEDNVDGKVLALFVGCLVLAFVALAGLRWLILMIATYISLNTINTKPATALQKIIPI